MNGGLKHMASDFPGFGTSTCKQALLIFDTCKHIHCFPMLSPKFLAYLFSYDVRSERKTSKRFIFNLLKPRTSTFVQSVYDRTTKWWNLAPPQCPTSGRGSSR